MSIIIEMKRFFGMSRQLILAPLLFTAMVTITLYFLGQAPEYIRGDTPGFKGFNSIEAVEDYLGFELVMPVYFPSYFVWPPSEIYGQREPVPMAETLFHTQQGDYGALRIYQIEADPESEDLPVRLPLIVSVHQETPVTLGEYNGTMVSGTGSKGEFFNGAYWRSERFYFIIITTRSARDLLTIAMSM